MTALRREYAKDTGADVAASPAAASAVAGRSGRWCLVSHSRNQQDHKRVCVFLSRQPEVCVADNKSG